MKRKKYRELNLYSYYDHAGIARHLEDMARQGCQLEKTGNTFWTYRRCDPAELHYAVVYFPKASQFDPEPPAEQREFWELCKATGWELVSSRYQMQIFCNPAKDPTPIETDPVVQVENVRAAMKRGLLLTSWLMLGCSILQIGMQLHSNRLLRDLLISGSSMMMLLFWGLVAINSIIELTAYCRWRKKAQAAAREEGVLLSPRSRRGWNLFFFLTATLIAAASLLSLVSYGSYGLYGASVAGIVLLYGVVLSLAVFGSRRLMKRLHFSAKANLVGNITITVITAFVLMFGTTRFAYHLVDNPVLLGHQNTEEWPAPNGGYTYTIYHDPLPLTVEDLTGETYPEGYSCYRDGCGTPLLMKYNFVQESRNDDPYLEYSVYKLGLKSLYEPVKNSFFKDAVFTIHGQIDFVIPHGWVAVDAAPWGALDAYQYHDDTDYPLDSYLLCYEDRIVEISSDLWANTVPTAEQMRQIEAALCADRFA